MTMKTFVLIDLNLLLDRHYEAVVSTLIQADNKLNIRSSKRATEVTCEVFLILLSIAKLKHIVKIYTKHSSKSRTVIISDIDFSARNFVELINTYSGPVDISGFQMWDTESLTDETAETFGIVRHLVPDGTILEPGKAFVVFGGGTPTGEFGGAQVLTTTTGAMNLNNSGDILTIRNAEGLVVLSFDIEPLSNNPNESYTRNPDLTGAFEQHADNTDLLFSPGTRIDGTPF